MRTRTPQYRRCVPRRVLSRAHPSPCARKLAGVDRLAVEAVVVAGVNKWC